MATTSLVRSIHLLHTVVAGAHSNQHIFIPLSISFPLLGGIPFPFDIHASLSVDSSHDHPPRPPQPPQPPQPPHPVDPFGDTPPTTQQHTAASRLSCHFDLLIPRRAQTPNISEHPRRVHKGRFGVQRRKKPERGGTL
jgi:hypothetical protein